MTRTIFRIGDTGHMEAPDAEGVWEFSYSLLLPATNEALKTKIEKAKKMLFLFCLRQMKEMKLEDAVFVFQRGYGVSEEKYNELKALQKSVIFEWTEQKTIFHELIAVFICKKDIDQLLGIPEKSWQRPSECIRYSAIQTWKGEENA